MFGTSFVRLAGILAVGAGLALYVAGPTGAAEDEEWREGGFQIGGPFGVVIGGGHGLRIGGRSGVQFGGGAGAKFGGANGVQFGGGAGAKFGGDGGVQFGGGAGAKFGSQQIGGKSTDGAVPPPSAPTGESTADDAEAPQAEVVEQPITVFYPADAKEKLVFKLNGDEYTIAPGQTMTLRRDRRWILQYERKPSGRRVQFELGGGRYEFRRMDAGWDLRPMALVEELSAPDAEVDAPPPPTQRRVRRRRR